MPHGMRTGGQSSSGVVGVGREKVAETRKRAAEWRVGDATRALSGIAIGCEKLIEAMDAQLVRKQDGRVTPDTWGLAALCVSSCAYFCEVALKTLQASLNGGTCTFGHDLVLLYDDVARLSGGAGSLDRSVRDRIRQFGRAPFPPDWVPQDIRGALETGRRNFTEWRYGLMEGTRPDNGVPKGLYAVAFGVRLALLERHPNLPQDIARAAGWSR